MSFFAFQKTQQNNNYNKPNIFKAQLSKLYLTKNIQDDRYLHSLSKSLCSGLVEEWYVDWWHTLPVVCGLVAHPSSSLHSTGPS
jgi:hypothetical protein